MHSHSPAKTLAAIAHMDTRSTLGCADQASSQKAAREVSGSDTMAKEFGAIVYRARSVLGRLTAANNRLTGASPVREILGGETVSDSFIERMWSTLGEIKSVFDAIDDEAQKLENFA